VTTYVVLRGREEVARLGPASAEFTDPDVDIGQRYHYEVLAIGEEGRGRPAPTVSVRTPVPSIEHAHFAGFYGIELVFRQIGLLSRFEGVPDPAVGDRTFQEWDIVSVCAPFQGACNVTLFGWELDRRGRMYKGTLPSTGFCGGRRVEGRQTVTLRVTDAAVVGRVLFVHVRRDERGEFPVRWREGARGRRHLGGARGTRLSDCRPDGTGVRRSSSDAHAHRT
jgi:hypothetical protein